MLAPLLLALALQQPGSAPAQATPWPPPGVVRLGDGVPAPQIVKEAKPTYTAEAMDAKVQGTVLVEAVIQPNGKVGDVRVVRSLDRQYGLDDQAVKAVKKWEFKPGKKDGVAIPVLVEIELTFTLRR